MLLVFCANKANIVIYYIHFTSIQNNLTTKILKKKESVCKELAHSGTCVILHFDFLCKVWLFIFLFFAEHNSPLSIVNVCVHVYLDNVCDRLSPLPSTPYKPRS